MKQDRAILTETGIKHNTLLYSCSLAIKDQWFYKVKDVVLVEFDIFYDPADNSLIYLDSGAGHVPCYLLLQNQVFSMKQKTEFFKRVNELKERRNFNK
ncbi:hypothetical protein BK127_41910 [Paenibacillus sp. FSL H7-0331]|nr:hypothetical protein BK127_41910 [Paenibacillus sp. FSL H7-0331]